MKTALLIAIAAGVRPATGMTQQERAHTSPKKPAVGGQRAAGVRLANYIVAKVNVEIITRRDIERALTVRGNRVTSAPSTPGESGEALVHHILSTLDAAAAGETISAGETEQLRGMLRQFVDRTLLRQVASRDLGTRHVDNIRAAVDRYLQRRQSAFDIGNAATLAEVSAAEMDRRIFEALLARNINVGRGAIRPSVIRQFFDSHLEDFREPTRITFRHIMIRAERPLSDPEAGTRAQELRARLHEGADFARLARQHSDGPRAGDGGLWQGVDPSTLLPQLAKRLVELSVGTVSDVFTTEHGYHIIQLVRRRAGGLRTFAHVQSDIEDFLYMRLLDSAIDTWLAEKVAEAFVWTLLDLQAIKLHERSAAPFQRDQERH